MKHLAMTLGNVEKGKSAAFQEFFKEMTQIYNQLRTEARKHLKPGEEIKADTGKEQVEAVIGLAHKMGAEGMPSMAFSAYHWAYNASGYLPEQRAVLKGNMEMSIRETYALSRLVANRLGVFFIKNVLNKGVASPEEVRQLISAGANQDPVPVS